MLNQIVLVGRLTSDIEVKESENGKKYSNLKLAIPRSFKNSEGIYDTDFVDVVVFDNVAGSTSDYCHKGDIVGVKGRIQSNNGDKEKNISPSVSIVGERVTFLSSKTKEEKENNEHERG